MKKPAFFRKENGNYTVYAFDRKTELSSIDDVTALMVERPDVDIKVVKIPPIKEDEIPSLLKYKLRIYPGHPEDTVFDYRVLTDKTQKYAVLFIMDKKVLETYQNAAGGKPLFLPYSLVQPLRKSYAKPKLSFLFMHDYWIEMLFYNGGVIESSSVVKREGKLKQNLRKLGALFPADREDLTCIVVCARSEHGEIEKAISEVFDKAVSFEYLHFETLFGSANNRVDYLFFSKRRKGFVHSRWFFALLMLAALFLLGLLFNKHYVSYQSRFDTLSEQINTMQKRQMATASLQDEVKNLEKKFAELNERIPYNTYQILSELTYILDEDMKITRFALDRGMFQIEAIGRNPLYLMERFKNNGRFQDVKLIQSIPINGTFKERFRVVGIAKTN